MARRLFFLSFLLLLVAACGEDESLSSDSKPTPQTGSLASSVGAAAGASAEQPSGEQTSSVLSFVGSDACVACHVAEGKKWKGSHHDRAMEVLSAESIEGHFDGSTLQHEGQIWRFLRDGDTFVVEIEESGKAIERLEVAYTFGFDPLQQYLVTRPDGRMQALPVAWDRRPAAAGGQRWIDLQPEGLIPPEDPLHWDRLAYNWNSQCASCHSTKLTKAYDESTHRFATRWSELDVGCEACHGPGSAHVAKDFGPRLEVETNSTEFRQSTETSRSISSGLKVPFESWNQERWQRAPGDRIATRRDALKRDPQIDVCAPCHSRRTQIASTPSIGDKFLDGYRPRLLDPGLYFEDGQIRDEVYVWGSFLQSRMFSAGVRCSDCHDPHSLTLRRTGNDLCTGCHDRAVFAVAEHHGHAPGSAGSECVDCHMPERVYMEIDGRRDHSFPTPRPQRSAALGAPDLCSECHAGRDTAWAEEQIASWREEGIEPRPHWSDQLVRGTTARVDVERWFEIAMDPTWPPIIRGNAWSRLAQEAGGSPPVAMLRERLRDGTDLERLGLIELAPLLPAEARAALFRPLLEDDLRTIRMGAALALADVPASIWRPADRSALARALAEYRAAQKANGERPEAQVNLGVLSARFGEMESARAAYLRALDLAPYFVPAYVNLADLDRADGRDQAAVDWLKQALALAPDEALTRYALGLALHRLGKSDEALAQLARAAKSAPNHPRLALGWALALDGLGRRSASIDVLSEAIDRGLVSPDLYQALVTMLRDVGEVGAARRRAAGWVEAWPNDPRAATLLRELSVSR